MFKRESQMSKSALPRTTTHGHHETNGTRVQLRLAPDRRRKIERAAAQSHKTLPQFVVEHAAAAAERVLRRRQTEVVLGPADWDVFFAALRNPPAPTTTLKAGFRRYRKLISQ